MVFYYTWYKFTTDYHVALYNKYQFRQQGYDTPVFEIPLGA